MPPAWAIVVATAPTTPWSGAVCSRIVIEYDDGVADMHLTLVRRRSGPTTQEDGDQQHPGGHLSHHDGHDEGGAMALVEPPGQDAAGQGGDGLERRERAVRRAESA